MSVIRVCDCECHDDSCYECPGPGPKEIDDREPGEAWQRVGDLDVCESCLNPPDLRYGCKTWQVFTPRDDIPRPAKLELVQPAYDKLIAWDSARIAELLTGKTITHVDYATWPPTVTTVVPDGR